MFIVNYRKSKGSTTLNTEIIAIMAAQITKLYEHISYMNTGNKYL